MTVTTMQGRHRRTELIDTQAEGQYLAWLLMEDGKGIAEDKVTSADFWSQTNAHVFSACLALHADGQHIDTITVRDKLAERGLLEATGADVCIELTDTIPLRSYASLIRRLAAQRRVQHAARVAGEMMGSTREAEALKVLEASQVALRELRAERDELNQPTPDDPLRGCPRLRAVALYGLERMLQVAAAPIVYSWSDIAVAGTIVLLAGGPSEGKTTLLFLILAARSAIGGRVRLLGRNVDPAPVGRYLLIIEGEHSEGSTARKLVRSLDILGVPRESLERVIVVARKSVTLGSAAWDEVTSMVRAGLVSDIAIDTIARCAPVDANDEAAQVAVFDALTATIEAAPNEESKPTVWLVAHTKKGGAGDLEAVSGSAQRVGQADSVLIVKGSKVRGQTVSSRVTFQKLREPPDEHPQPIDFRLVRDVVDGDYSLHESSPADAYAASDSQPASQPDTHKQHFGVPVSEQIAQALANGPRTRNSIRTALPHLSDARVKAGLAVLADGRRIVRGWATIDGQRRQTFGLVDGALHAAE